MAIEVLSDIIRELDRELARLLEPELPDLSSVGPISQTQVHFHIPARTMKDGRWVDEWQVRRIASDPAACHELKLEMVRRGFEWALGSNRRGSDDARFFYAHIFDRAFNLLSEAESEQTEMAAFALAALAALKGAAK